MEVDLERIMILLQRRCNSLQEIKRITGELLEYASRNDQVSIGLLLQIRADEMAKAEEAREQIWLTAEQGYKEAEKIRALMSREFLETGDAQSFEERKILEIRKKTALLLREVQEADQRLNISIGGKRSFYAADKNKTPVK